VERREGLSALFHDKHRARRQADESIDGAAYNALVELRMTHKATTRRLAFSCLINPMTPSTTWPGTKWVSIVTPATFASAFAASMTGAKRWFASSFSSAI
jgi:hypothetical protein